MLDYKIQILKKTLKHLCFIVLGQCCVLQLCEETVLPGQLAPPYWGAGLVHVRCLSCVPLPHVTVHAP